jgi:hypothetical protein
VTASVRRLPVADSRLDCLATAPADALALIRRAIEGADSLGALIRQAARAPEIAAAVEDVAGIRRSLASLEITATLLASAYRAGREDEAAAAARRASRARLRPVPAGTGACGDGAR